MNIGIIGLGLIGGSMARAIRRGTEHTVWGLDIREDTMEKALLCGAVEERLTDARLSECDLVLLALTPTALAEVAPRIAPLVKPGAVVVDLCGVKREPVALLAPLARANGFLYIGGHPMAGREHGGFDHSSADLFDNASMILTPDETTDIRTLAMLKELFLAAGFRELKFSTPDEHDRTIAYTSQLAHVVSNAYVKSPTALIHSGFSAGSFKDLTRVAFLDENMWTSLFLANRDHLIEELSILMKNLGEYADALEANDADRLRALLREGRLQKLASQEPERSLSK